MDNQSQTCESNIASLPRPATGQDPILRLNCLEMATRLGMSHADEVVHAAQLFINFVGCAPLNPPMKPVSNLPAYQQRVIDERDELGERITKLCQFVDTEIFANLPRVERDRMHRQNSAMQKYYEILIERIAAFPKEGA